MYAKLSAAKKEILEIYIKVFIVREEKKYYEQQANFSLRKNKTLMTL